MAENTDLVCPYCGRIEDDCTVMEMLCSYGDVWKCSKCAKYYKVDLGILYTYKTTKLR